MHYYISVLKKYAVFSGRARRAEFWYFTLFSSIIMTGLGIIGSLISAQLSILTLLYWLGTLIPGLAVTVRRLHDTNRSGWWWFIVFVPLIGFIVLFIFSVLDSQPGDNKYGSNPKEVVAS